MSSMHPIQRTSELWDLSPTLPAMLCASSELNKAGQSQGGSDARCDSQAKGHAQQGRDCLGIEITETSYHDKGWE